MIVLGEPIEQQEHDSLKARHHQLLTALVEICAHLAVRQSMLPLQLPTRVLRLVM